MHMEDPIASVIVPTHRGAHRLPTLLDALAAQSFDGPWEVVFVIDGLVDETIALLEAYQQGVPLRLLVMPDPVGVCRGLNAGYAEAKGRVLIRCDDDLTPASDMVSRHVAWHQGPERRGVVGATRDVFPDTPYARAYGRDANCRSLAATYARAPERLWINWAAHNSVTRETWDLAGGFDDRFVYGQDSELGWRLHASGVTIVVDPELEVDHRGPTTTAANRVPRAYVAGSSQRLFVEVHPGARTQPTAASTLVARLWTAGVVCLSTVIRKREGYRRLGAALDRLLAVLPSKLGRRLVAFAVEGAGRSGQRNGPRDLNEFKSQKAQELSAELPA
jgi:GT2 family glycosyltransferase